jgi:hypothetical protein
MPKTLIDDVKVGQVLERPVLTASGVMLVRAGTPLSQALIERLRGIGFTDLHVTASDDSVNQATTADSAAIEARFRGHEENALMMQLKDLLVRARGEPTGGR